MKINISHIISGHVRSLGDGNKGYVFFVDLFIFYFVPGLIAYLFVFVDVPIHRDVYNVMISAFAIFGALLLNVQVALFSIYHRSPRVSSNDPQDDRAEVANSNKNMLFSELNTNISYLIILACICVVLFLYLHLINAGRQGEKYVIVYLVAHFILTLLMVIKRSYAAFQKEYTL